jgi:hypothetical protein
MEHRAVSPRVSTMAMHHRHRWFASSLEPAPCLHSQNISEEYVRCLVGLSHKEGIHGKMEKRFSNRNGAGNTLVALGHRDRLSFVPFHV